MLSDFLTSSQVSELHHLKGATVKALLAHPWPVPTCLEIPGPAQLAH